MSDDLTIPRPTYRRPQHRRTSIDPGTRRLLLIAGGLAGGLVVIFGASSMIGHRNGEVPTVQADPGPIRVKPENPGGLQVANANNEIFSGGDDTTGSKLAPQPEVPDPTAMRKAPPPSPPESPPAPQQAVIAPPAPPPVRIAHPGPTAVQPPAARTAVGKSTPLQTATHPAPPPAERLALEKPPLDKPGLDKPGLEKSMAATPPEGKHVLVQLAALTTEDAAKAEWQHLARQMPALLGSHQPAYSRVERDGHTLWRLRTSGFGDMAQARTFCEQVRAKGGGCSVEDF